MIEELFVRIKGTCGMDEIKALSLPVDPPSNTDDRSQTLTFGGAFALAFYKELEDLHTHMSPDIGPIPTNATYPRHPSPPSRSKKFAPGLSRMERSIPHVSLARLGLQLGRSTPASPESAWLLSIHNDTPRELFAGPPLIMFATLGVGTYARILVDEGEEYQDVMKGVRYLRGEVEHERCVALLNVIFDVIFFIGPAC